MEASSVISREVLCEGRSFVLKIPASGIIFFLVEASGNRSGTDAMNDEAADKRLLVMRGMVVGKMGEDWRGCKYGVIRRLVVLVCLSGNVGYLHSRPVKKPWAMF